MHNNKPLKERADIELMVLKVEMEQALYQLQAQIRDVDAEIMKRVDEFKKKKNETV